MFACLFSVLLLVNLHVMYGPSIKRRVSLCSSPGPASSGSTSTCRLVVGTADAVAGAAVGARRGGEADEREEDSGLHRQGVTSKICIDLTNNKKNLLWLDRAR